MRPAAGRVTTILGATPSTPCSGRAGAAISLTERGVAAGAPTCWNVAVRTNGPVACSVPAPSVSGGGHDTTTHPGGGGQAYVTDTGTRYHPPAPLPPSAYAGARAYWRVWDPAGAVASAVPAIAMAAARLGSVGFIITTLTRGERDVHHEPRILYGRAIGPSPTVARV